MKIYPINLIQFTKIFYNFNNKKTVELSESTVFMWSHWGESNSRPTGYESVALPTELQRHTYCILSHICIKIQYPYCKFLIFYSYVYFSLIVALFRMLSSCFLTPIIIFVIIPIATILYRIITRKYIIIFSIHCSICLVIIFINI